MARRTIPGEYSLPRVVKVLPEQIKDRQVEEQRKEVEMRKELTLVCVHLSLLV